MSELAKSLKEIGETFHRWGENIHHFIDKLGSFLGTALVIIAFGLIFQFILQAFGQKQTTKLIRFATIFIIIGMVVELIFGR